MQKLLQSCTRYNIKQLKALTLGKAESGKDKRSCGYPVLLCAHE